MKFLISTSGAAVFLALANAHAKPTETLLHVFAQASDATRLRSAVTPGTDGTIFGVAMFGGGGSDGKVFRLTPPAPGQTAWTETTLRTFIADANGAFPAGSLVLDEKGNLYGTTLGGNNNRGVAFELSPPTQPDGDWTETVLHGFSGPDGFAPRGALLRQKNGTLFGTTSEGGPSFNNGLVFELLPPTAHSAGWREKTLFAFSDGVGSAPEAGVISDSQGNLYGTTAGGGQFGSGVVFELSPPAKGGTGWTETVLHSFTGGSDGSAPFAGLVMDSQGALFGTASTGGAAGSGVVFRLVPPTQAGGAWTETVLHDFTGDRDGGAPMAGLALMANGQLVGTASKGGANQFGVVFRLTPPKTEGGAWNQKVLHSFTGIAEGGFPVAAPVVFKHAVFGVAEPTTPQRVSDVFKLVP